jgi:dihydrofolate synthase/folylpolyglutamate synthase
MNYQETLDYLYSFINYGLKRQDRYAPEQMLLERPQAMLAQLNNPQDAYPVIHLTGTKGKGSVGAICAAMLQKAGYKAALFSSPHLQDFRERFRINGQLIEQDEVIALVDHIRPVIEKTPGLIWFEIITAMAFEYFRQQKPDIAVIEVGLGGRLDPTNVVSPLVSVITSLSLDHTNLLGDTLADIAWEKAGIIKPDIPVISAPQQPAAQAVIERVAQERNAPLTRIGHEWQFKSLGGNLSVERWRAAPQGQPLQAYETVLLGRHQAINATVALATVYELTQHGFVLPDDAISTGLMQVNWPGRLEIAHKNPVVVLDAAHNGASARCLQETLSERFAARPLVTVFAAKSDKDVQGMLKALLPITDHLVITQAVDSRAESPEIIAELARTLAFERPIDIIPDVAHALAAAERLAGDSGMACVTGSLYLVGEARDYYNLTVGQAAYLQPYASH